MRTALMSEMIFAIAENTERRAQSAENSNLVNNDSKKKTSQRWAHWQVLFGKYSPEVLQQWHTQS